MIAPVAAVLPHPVGMELVGKELPIVFGSEGLPAAASANFLVFGGHEGHTHAVSGRCQEETVPPLCKIGTPKEPLERECGKFYPAISAKWKKLPRGKNRRVEETARWKKNPVKYLFLVEGKGLGTAYL